jgi:hypothetical protein
VLLPLLLLQGRHVAQQRQQPVLGMRRQLQWRPFAPALPHELP